MNINVTMPPMVMINSLLSKQLEHVPVVVRMTHLTIHKLPKPSRAAPVIGSLQVVRCTS